jgi:hypothetical protein
MEQYFTTISETMEGYGEFETEAWAFKVQDLYRHCFRVPPDLGLQHDRLSVERRLDNWGTLEDTMGRSSSIGPIKTSDIARLMELFQVGTLCFASVSRTE